MTNLPVILLDVDGALSADAIGNPAAYGYVEHRLPEGRAVLSDRICERVGRLRERGELTWCTGWGEKANRAICPIAGWEPLPVLDLTAARIALNESRGLGTMIPFPQHTWKLEAVKAYVGEDRPVVWIDDQLGFDVQAWAKERPGPTALLAVAANQGIQDGQLDRLDVWLDAPPAGATMIFPHRDV